ncbi:TIM barrel protein [Actinopolymorpha alba]|uniref:TIM barrel protein n=1 Tax=Actinopolymorpha alba TaxID=533267 RepID=UPI00037956D4|nr:TIM barrel protein [Actinopolymorpha alba]
MYELSPCIELLFTEYDRPFLDRIRAAAAAGVPAVEFWFWQDQDIAEVQAVLKDTGMSITSLVAEPWGAAINPDRRPEFLQGVTQACALASRLAAPAVVVVAGDELPEVPRATQHATVVEALTAAAPIAADYGVTLVLEPLNTFDHRGHYLRDTSEGLDIIREVDQRSVRLLYDLYHSVMMGEDPQQVLSGNGDLIAHVQIADVPGRGEPGTGNIDWSLQLNTLHDVGYRGRLGLEYYPQTDSAASLAYLQRLLSRSV